MGYDPSRHNRKSIPLKGYDYSRKGLYFLTLCAQGGTHIFGEVENEKMILNDGGKVARECWMAIPEHFPNAVLHEFVIMPNHIYRIIELTTLTIGTKIFCPFLKIADS